MKAPNVTDGDWSVDGTRIYARVGEGVKREVGVATRADVVARGHVNANAQMLAASKYLAVALNAAYEYEHEMQGADWMRKQEVWRNVKAALLAAGYTEA